MNSGACPREAAFAIRGTGSSGDRFLVWNFLAIGLWPIVGGEGLWRVTLLLTDSPSADLVRGNQRIY